MKNSPTTSSTPVYNYRKLNNKADVVVVVAAEEKEKQDHENNRREKNNGIYPKQRVPPASGGIISVSKKPVPVPATEPPKKKLERMSTEDVNASAEEFIQKFRQQLFLQRLESIENYEQMLKRGT